jgi:tetratricopeptide (TPR) repeat protein
MRGDLHSLLRLLLLMLLFSFPATLFSSYQVIAPFWVSKIDSAFFIRDAWYKSIFPDTTNYSVILLNDIQRQVVCDRITARKDALSPWYHFLAGIIDCDHRSDASSLHFATSLALAKSDPGITWALFIEFTRNLQNEWAERCLMQLEKLFLASGASSAPAIAQQLLFYAQENERKKDLSAAFSYYAWAERFDPLQMWSGLHRLRNCIPSHMGLFFPTLSSMILKCGKSWQLQIGLISHAFDWFRLVCVLFVIAVFTGLGARYLPCVVHPVSDRFPDTVPATLKTLLPIIVLLSFLSFGLLPFLWLVAFLIWRFTDKKEKVLAGAAIVIMTASPLAVRFQDMLLQVRSIQNTPSIYSRSLQEGYQSELHQSALKKIILNPADALAFLSASILSIKKNDTAAALFNVQNALSLRQKDRVFETFAGNIAYQSKQYPAAINHFQQVLTVFPDDMTARFNLSQCYARNSDTTINLDFIKILSPRDRARINDFINENNVYFTDNWPVSRQVMSPDFDGKEFWLSIFPAYNGSWKTAAGLWGQLFFGIPLLHSLIIFTLLFIILVAWGFTSAAHSTAASVGNCRLCHRTICTQCGKKELCPACTQKTQYIRNVKTLAAIQSKIIRRRRLVCSMFGHLLDIALPGTGMLYNKNSGMVLIIPLLVCTSAVYAAIISISSVQLSYPHWISYGIMGKIPYALFFYNGAFLIRTVLFLFRKKEPVLA